MHQAVESTPALQFRERMKQLRTGMTKEEVLALAGDPTREQAAATDGAGLERWIYELQHRPKYRTIAAEMEEVAFVDPITGEAQTVLEARPEEEKFQLIERFTLGFDDNQVLADLDYVAERRRT
ncbi:MAG: hypothetical protein SynsKO_26800 [Synoicihabitans sp.]